MSFLSLCEGRLDHHSGAEQECGDGQQADERFAYGEDVLGHMMWFWIDVRGKGGVYQSCTLEGEALLEPLLHLIEHDGQNDDQAGDDLFPKFLDSEEHEAIGEDAHDECADDRSQIVPRPPASEVPPSTTAAIAFSS